MFKFSVTISWQLIQTVADLLNVLAQIANKMGFKKNVICRLLPCPVFPTTLPIPFLPLLTYHGLYIPPKQQQHTSTFHSFNHHDNKLVNL
jgi:hypothetical protein